MLMSDKLTLPNLLLWFSQKEVKDMITSSSSTGDFEEQNCLHPYQVGSIPLAQLQAQSSIPNSLEADLSALVQSSYVLKCSIKSSA